MEQQSWMTQQLWHLQRQFPVTINVNKDGSTGFDFNNPVTVKTDVYASWIADTEELFTITPQEGYQISSVLLDGLGI